MLQGSKSPIVQKDALKFGHTFAIENSIEKP